MVNAQDSLQQAIAAAKTQDWSLAVAANETLLALNPQDVGALNRLGIAQAQLGDTTAARRHFERALKIDKSNSIAKKNLDRLKVSAEVLQPQFGQETFIEEPGRARTIQLHRLAGREVLSRLTTGQLCGLKPKSRYISVEVEGTYVGALPEDISFRLSKLMQTGNTYSCFIQAVSASHCSVYIKETHRSSENHYIQSFLAPRTSQSVAGMDEQLINEEDLLIEANDSEEDKGFEDELLTDERL